MKIKSKFDYCKDAPRKQITTTINKDLFAKFQILSIELNEPTSKMYDVLLMEILDNEKKLQQFKMKVKSY